MLDRLTPPFVAVFICLSFTCLQVSAQDAPQAIDDQIEQLTAELEAAKARIAELEAQLDEAANPEKRLLREQKEREEALEALKETMAELPPQEAADLWIARVDEHFQSAEPDENAQNIMHLGYMETNNPFAPLVAALPRPEAWSAINDKLQARAQPEDKIAMLRHTLLRNISGTLNNQLLDIDALLDALRPHFEKKDQWAQNQELKSLETYITTRLERTTDIPRRIELLDLIIKLADREESWNALELPDLVELVGEQEAQRIFTAALMMQHRSIAVPKGEKTQALARRIAHEKLDELQTPPWDLTLDVGEEAAALYTALLEKFAPNELNTEPAEQKIISTMPGMDMGMMMPGYSNQSNRTEADGYHFLRLVIAGKADEATAWLKAHPQTQMPYQALRQLTETGGARQVYDLFHTLLTDNPNLPLWPQIGELAVRLGKAEEVTAMLAAALEDESLTPKQRTRLQNRYTDALLANDRVKDAVALMREIASKETWPDNQTKADTLREVGIRLAKIGHLLENKVWLTEGLILIEQAQNVPKNDDHYGVYETTHLAAALVQLGRYKTAETILRAELENASKISADNIWEVGGGYQTRQLLTELMNLLIKQQRHQEAIDLLDKQPGWGETDLVDLLHQSAEDETPLAYLVAVALVELDRADEAKPIIHAALQNKTGYDPLYELFIQTEGQTARQQLEAMAARDPFEERPLIWLAQLDLEAGDAAAAEKTIRRAIAIDPSDGEQGKGHRMRAYAVLAEAMRVQGDEEQAKIFDGAIAAVRLAEDADDYYDVGMLTRAISMYQDALNYFADAYCIQSRLAVQLVEQGRLEEAEARYRRAYELMPDSFGRMESHCFGCEGIFRGPLAQSVAERVFNKLAEQRPDSPQVHYLLGYLRQSQDRHAEAAESFSKAVELDPDYINAWKQLSSMPDSAVSPELRDKAVFELLRIDPRSKHSSPNVSKVHDIAELWRTLNAVEADETELPETLRPLPAVVALREKIKEQMPQYSDMFEDNHGLFNHYYKQNLDPGQAVASNVLIAPLIELIDQSAQLEMLETLELDLDIETINQ